MNKILEKKIDKVEMLKAREVEKRNEINASIENLDKQLKDLLELKKQAAKQDQIRLEIIERINQYQV